MLAKLTLQALALIALGFSFTLRMPQVTGFSMEPRINSGDDLLLNTLAYRLRSPQRDDIIAFRHRRGGPAYYVKRIVGLPGDTICVHRGVVSLNGSTLPEPYVREPDTHDAPCLTVPSQAYYVLGDNRGASDDSRSWGVVDGSAIVGRAIFILWPIAHVGAL